MTTRWYFIGAVFICLALLSDGALAQRGRGPFEHEPRSVRSRNLDQKHLRLDLVFDFEANRVEGKATHTLALFQRGQMVSLDAVQMTIQSVKVLSPPGEPTGSSAGTFEHRDGKLEIQLGREYGENEEIQLEVTYTIEKPKHGFHFVNPDPTEKDSHLKMVWTQCEPEFARYWFPCFDHPSDRLTSEIVATVPESFEVLSNGILAEKSEPRDGKRTWHWKQTQSHVPYLLSVVAGDFEVFRQEWDGIPVLSYVPRGRLADAPRNFEKTAKMVEYFSKKIGVRYPWPKYAQICVDEYGWGGMEHTSATTLNLNTIRNERAILDSNGDNLVSHELAHQWWGDLLTCKDWAELWLNESFATYFATLWEEYDRGIDEATWTRRDEAKSYLDEDKTYRRPIVSYQYNSPENMFDRHTYPKGGRVLHMLRSELGDAAFWRVLRRYAETNRHRNVETADLRRAIEDEVGQGFNWFFDQWIDHGGHPEFRFTWTWNESTKMVAARVEQTQSVDAMTPLFKTHVELELRTGQGIRIEKICVTKADETFHFSSESRPTRVVFDPRDVILKTLRCEKSVDEWLDQAKNSVNMAARLDAVEALSGQLDSERVAPALREIATKDAFWGIRRKAVEILGADSNPATRDVLVRVATKDENSAARVMAISQLAKFPHDDAKSACRKAIKEDRSYQVVAAAVTSLSQLDRAGCEGDLLTAIEEPSQGEVILTAAANGLREIKSTQLESRLTSLLEESNRPERKIAILAALSSLNPDSESMLSQLSEAMRNRRTEIRRAAINAIVATGSEKGLELLSKHRVDEETPGMIRLVDESLAKLRDKVSKAPTREDLKRLQDREREIEERVKKLESSK